MSLAKFHLFIRRHREDSSSLAAAGGNSGVHNSNNHLLCPLIPDAYSEDVDCSSKLAVIDIVCKKSITDHANAIDRSRTHGHPPGRSSDVSVNSHSVVATISHRISSAALPPPTTTTPEGGPEGRRRGRGGPRQATDKQCTPRTM